VIDVFMSTYSQMVQVQQGQDQQVVDLRDKLKNHALESIIRQASKQTITILFIQHNFRGTWPVFHTAQHIDWIWVRERAIA